MVSSRKWRNPGIRTEREMRMRYITTQTTASYKLPLEVRQAVEQAVEWARTPPERGGPGLIVPYPEREARGAPQLSHLAAWILFRFFALPKAVQKALILEGKSICDEHLALDDPFPIAERPGSIPGEEPPVRGRAGDGAGPAVLTERRGRAKRKDLASDPRDVPGRIP